MTTDRDPVEVVRRYVQGINDHDWDAVAAVTDPALATVVRDGLWRAHPDLHLDVEWIHGTGDKVSMWCYGTGTHQAPWVLPVSVAGVAGRTLAPTGRRWRAACSTTYRVDRVRLVEVWAVWDWLALLTQLDVVTIDCS